MNRILNSLVAASGLLLLVSGPAFADEAAEKLVDDAMPFMYHSCKSVVDEANGDEEYIHKVIRALTAVSLYNHEIDISKYAKNDEEKAVLRARFVKALRAECEANPKTLLAGAIDDAVMHALSL